MTVVFPHEIAPQNVLPFSELLGSRIRIARRVKRMSQAELAMRAGVSQATISRIELGRGDVVMREYDIVLRALGHMPFVH